VNKLLLTIFISLFSAGQAQAADTFCLVVGQSKVFSRKVTVTVDYGEKTGMFKDTRLRDEQTGKVAKFNSMVDALNYMSEKGWNFVNAYAITTGNQNVYHFLLKR